MAKRRASAKAKRRRGSIQQRRRQIRKDASFGELSIREGAQWWSPPPEFRLFVAYPGGLSREMDLRLFKIVGRYSDASGCWIDGPDRGMRDHDWYFTRRAQALAARTRLRAAKIKGLKITLIGPLL